MPPWLETSLRVVAGVAGATIAWATFMSSVKLVVVPRGGSQRITRFVFICVRWVIEKLAPPGRSFAERDRWLSLYAPVSLVLIPFAWFTLSIGGFSLLHWAIRGGAYADSLRISGSSTLTLGVAFNSSLPAALVAFLQASLGIITGALLISYLPSLYQSYQRRETLVGMLESRAGVPPAPYEMIGRFHRIGGLELLDDDVFNRWEQWFAEVEESHTSFAALVFFRSPHPDRSWITAAGTVLDSAALVLSSVDRPFSPRTALCLRSGFLCLRRVADYFGLPYDPDPVPTDAVSVTQAEFDAVYDDLDAAGVPLVTDRLQAWRDFQGWRVNYDAVLVSISKLVVAPPAAWSSDRPGERLMPTLRRPGGRPRAQPERRRTT
jgi:hypothetical protein